MSDMMGKDWAELVKEFHDAQGSYTPRIPTGEIPLEVTLLRVRLIEEEAYEYLEAVQTGAGRDKVADALCDLLYVTVGTAIAHGMGPMLDDLFREVCRSNMTKDFRPIAQGEKGGFKGPGFRPPRLAEVFEMWEKGFLPLGGPAEKEKQDGMDLVDCEWLGAAALRELCAVLPEGKKYGSLSGTAPGASHIGVELKLEKADMATLRLASRGDERAQALFRAVTLQPAVAAIAAALERRGPFEWFLKLEAPRAVEAACVFSNPENGASIRFMRAWSPGAAAGSGGPGDPGAPAGWVTRLDVAVAS